MATRSPGRPRRHGSRSHASAGQSRARQPRALTVRAPQPARVQSASNTQRPAEAATARPATGVPADAVERRVRRLARPATPSDERATARHSRRRRRARSRRRRARQAAWEGEAMTPTLRRLNDRERYYGLSWPGWVALAAAGGILYGADQGLPVRLARDRDRRRSRDGVLRERRARACRGRRSDRADTCWRSTATAEQPSSSRRRHGLTSSGSSSTSPRSQRRSLSPFSTEPSA